MFCRGEAVSSASPGPTPFELSVKHLNYSVLYEYIKQQVDVRFTRTTVEISSPVPVLPPICGSMAVPTSTAQWKSICH